jgi:hypothetical protein
LRTSRFFFAACLLTALAAFAPARPQAAADPVNRTPDSFIGERLVYRIQWDPPWYLFFLPAMEAGEVELQLTDQAEFDGKMVQKIAFKGHSSGTLAKMVGFKIEDEFTLFTEPETYCTLGAISKIREGKRKRKVEVQYLRETSQLHIREIDEAVSPAKVKKDETKNNIPNCVHDPFSALYLFRQSPLQPKYSQTYALANDDKIRDVRATVEKQEIIQGPSGPVPAWRVNTAALMGSLFKEGGLFRLWLSADDKKVPIQFEVKVKLGRVLGRLKS